MGPGVSGVHLIFTTVCNLNAADPAAFCTCTPLLEFHLALATALITAGVCGRCYCNIHVAYAPV